MKNYVERVFRKEKKPIDLDRLFLKVENLLGKDSLNFSHLSHEQKEEIMEIVEDGVNN